MHRFDVKLDGIDKIVLSHGNGDHAGGIEIVRNLRKVDVFVPKSFSNHSKARLMNKELGSMSYGRG